VKLGGAISLRGLRPCLTILQLKCHSPLQKAQAIQTNNPKIPRAFATAEFDRRVTASMPFEADQRAHRHAELAVF
jgi:hypothetical protein